MKPQLIFPLLMLFTQVALADDEFADKLCAEIQKEAERPNLCQKIAGRYPNQKTIMLSNCFYAVEQFLENPHVAFQYCGQTFRSITPDSTASNDYFAPTAQNAASAIGAASMTAVTMTSTADDEVPPMISVSMNKCQQASSDSYTCTFDSPITIPGLDEILSLSSSPLSVSARNPKYTQEACNCFKEASQKTVRQQGVVRFEAEVLKEKAKINDVIFKAAGVKILNSFAANLEDVNFFRSNNTALLGGDESAKKLRCNNVKEYRAKIQEKCSANGIDPTEKKDEIDERVNAVLSSLGDTGDVNSLEKKFETLENEILNIKLDSAHIDKGQSGTLSRIQFDKLRFGAVLSRPEVRFLSDVTNELMDHPVLGPEIKAKINDEKKSPGHAIFKIIKDEGRPEVKTLLTKMAAAKKDDVFFKNLLGVLESPNPNDLEIYISEQVSNATDLHPGLKAVFRDGELFNKVRAAHGKTSHSLLDTMTHNPSLLVEYFDGRCDDIQEQFAEAVCVPEGDFVNRTNPEDLNRLLSAFDSKINSNLKDLILCRIPKIQDKQSVFQRLAFNRWDKMNQSDYWEMRTRKKGQQSNTLLTRVRSLIESGDKKANSYMANLSSLGSASGSPDLEYVSSIRKKDSYTFAQEPGPKEPASDRELAVARDVAKGLSSFSEGFGKTDSNLAGNNAAPLIDYALAAPPVAVDANAGKTTKSERSSRAVLRDLLADAENADEVDKHLSQTKDEDHRELLRLREELAKSKDLLNNVTAQASRERLKDLQAQVKALENEPAKTQISAPQESDTSAPRSNSRSVASSGTNQVSTGPADIARDNMAFSAGAQTSGADNGSSGSSSPGLASTGNARINANGLEGNFAMSSSAQGEIIIEQSNLISGQAMAPEDLNQVIVKYVQQSDLDVNSLKQMKDQEVVIRYKVLENGIEVTKVMRVKSETLTEETKKFLEQQIALREKDNKTQEARRAYSFATLKHLLGIRNTMN